MRRERTADVADYSAGDLILYGRHGVCRVEEIKQVRPSGGVEKEYYVLRPLYQNRSCCIRIPADQDKVYCRPIISGAEAQRLIRRIPQVPAEPYYNRNLNQLREHYRTCLENLSCESLISLTKSLYKKKEETEAQRKKFGTVDERFMREAEDLLYGEFAAALEIERDSVQNYIANALQIE
ncbi:MAG: CarD family transcriptional regulator [Oscillospiraceae bacterium]|nr:CarD family transcriptional regulator [Oscillospiraceae bacterium]